MALYHFKILLKAKSKIEKVPSDIQGEKSREKFRKKENWSHQLAF